MPETYFRVRWPDGEEQSCYSPSSVVAEYFAADQTYALSEFLRISESALSQASERVRQKYGFYCSSAADKLKQIQQHATRFSASDPVTIVQIHN